MSRRVGSASAWKGSGCTILYIHLHEYFGQDSRCGAPPRIRLERDGSQNSRCWCRPEEARPFFDGHATATRAAEPSASRTGAARSRQRRRRHRARSPRSVTINNAVATRWTWRSTLAGIADRIRLSAPSQRVAPRGDRDLMVTRAGTWWQSLRPHSALARKESGRAENSVGRSERSAASHFVIAGSLGRHQSGVRIAVSELSSAAAALLVGFWGASALAETGGRLVYRASGRLRFGG